MPRKIPARTMTPTDFNGRLPDGKETRDRELYLQEWLQIRNQLEQRFGFKITGFDPGFLITDAKVGGGVFTLPLWAAKRILSASKDAERYQKLREAINTLGRLPTKLGDFIRVTAGSNREGIDEQVDALKDYRELEVKK